MSFKTNFVRSSTWFLHDERLNTDWANAFTSLGEGEEAQRRIELMIDRMVDPNQFIHTGETGLKSPLSLACCAHNARIVELLLERGADPNLGELYWDDAFRTPLTYVGCMINAGGYVEDYENIIESLVRHGADVDLGVNFTERITTKTAGPHLFPISIFAMVGSYRAIKLLVDKHVNLYVDGAVSPYEIARENQQDRPDLQDILDLLMTPEEVWYETYVNNDIDWGDYVDTVSSSSNPDRSLRIWEREKCVRLYCALIERCDKEDLRNICFSDLESIFYTIEIDEISPSELGYIISLCDIYQSPKSHRCKITIQAFAEPR